MVKTLNEHADVWELPEWWCELHASVGREMGFQIQQGPSFCSDSVIVRNSGDHDEVNWDILHLLLLYVAIFFW